MMTETVKILASKEYNNSLKKPFFAAFHSQTYSLNSKLFSCYLKNDYFDDSFNDKSRKKP